MKTASNIIISSIIILSLVAFTVGFFILVNDTEKYIEDLKAENVMVRKKAIYYLGKGKKLKSVPLLIQLANVDQPKELRICAIEALGKIGDENSADALIGFLKGRDKEIIVAAINALGKIKSSKALVPLIEFKGNQDLQINAIWALGNIGDNRAIPALTKLLESQDKFISYNAAQALKNIGSGE